jgi:hypothetical protein
VNVHCLPLESSDLSTFSIFPFFSTSLGWLRPKATRWRFLQSCGTSCPKFTSSINRSLSTSRWTSTASHTSPRSRSWVGSQKGLLSHSPDRQLTDTFLLISSSDLIMICRDSTSRKLQRLRRKMGTRHHAILLCYKMANSNYG